MESANRSIPVRSLRRIDGRIASDHPQSKTRQTPKNPDTHRKPSENRTSSEASRVNRTVAPLRSGCSIMLIPGSLEFSLEINGRQRQRRQRLQDVVARLNKKAVLLGNALTFESSEWYRFFVRTGLHFDPGIFSSLILRFPSLPANALKPGLKIERWCD